MNILVDISAIEAQNLAAVAWRSKCKVSLDPPFNLRFAFKANSPVFLGKKRSARAEAEMQAGCHGHWHLN